MSATNSHSNGISYRQSQKRTNATHEGEAGLDELGDESFRDTDQNYGSLLTGQKTLRTMERAEGAQGEERPNWATSSITSSK